jgi:hypothetical protein
MDDEDWEHSGQQDVGCVATTAMRRPVSVIWTWSISIPSGRGRNGVLSITTSLLRQHGIPEVFRGKKYSILSHSMTKGCRRAAGKCPEM